MMKSEFSQKDDKKRLKQSAFDEGLRRLNWRIRTEKELTVWLSEKGYDDVDISCAICQLKDLGYLNDEEYCRQYFFYSKKKGKADYRILMELEEKGITSSVAKNIFSRVRSQSKEENIREGEGVELDDRSLATEIAHTMRTHHLDSFGKVDEKFKAKVSRRLANLGYPSSTIYYVIGTLGNAKENEE